MCSLFFIFVPYFSFSFRVRFFVFISISMQHVINKVHVDLKNKMADKIWRDINEISPLQVRRVSSYLVIGIQNMNAQDVSVDY